jgi:hypothetical protein
VARDLAAFAYARAFLDLDKGAKLGLIADRATIEVHELRQLDILT